MQTVILGLDAFDPAVFERLLEQGKAPNLARYTQNAGYARFTVANPPQSEVSWTSIATGLNPGGHGVFDFVHRDPATYALNVSLLPTKQGLFGTQFVPPHSARTIFDQVVQQGFPATVLWWPATFPARPESPVRTVPGLGTPDIRGRLGVGSEFRVDLESFTPGERKTPVARLQQQGKDRYRGLLEGPARKKRQGAESSFLEFELELKGEGLAQLWIDKQRIELVKGEWSSILELSFRMGYLVEVSAITQVILTQTDPEVKLYFLPLQIHPLRSPWRYGTPRSFVKESWRSCGPFLTLGWPQDTTGLEDGCITDEQFLDLCTSITTAREKVLMRHLHDFDEGIIAAVFDTLDRIQHMFWRDRPDLVEAWYVKMDALAGRVERRLAELGKGDTNLVIVSDHGFSDFDYKIHLNHWLIDHGYLVVRDAEVKGLQGVDWAKSQAYAVGLNSIYLNVKEREGQGSIPSDLANVASKRLRDELLAWRGPDGRPIIQRIWHQHEAFDGPLVGYGPDLVIGYAPGYRASAQTGLGKWNDLWIERNSDHWGGDHCIDPQAVPGVLFSSRGLRNFPQPSYQDIPALTIEGIPDSGSSTPPPSSYSREDAEIVEERLKSLGYL